MTNKEIYKRTLVFSLRRLLFDAISVIVLAGLCIGGFFIMDKASDRGLVGLLIGSIIGLILLRKSIAKKMKKRFIKKIYIYYKLKIFPALPGRLFI